MKFQFVKLSSINSPQHFGLLGRVFTTPVQHKIYILSISIL